MSYVNHTIIFKIHVMILRIDSASCWHFVKKTFLYTVLFLVEITKSKLKMSISGLFRINHVQKGLKKKIPLDLN